MPTTKPEFTKQDFIRLYRENEERFLEIFAQKLKARADDWQKFDFVLRLESDGSVKITIQELMEQYRMKIVPEAASDAVSSFAAILPSGR